MAYAYPPPPKRARSSASMKPFVNYIPAKKYPPCQDTDILLAYPLTLYPRTAIQIYRNREHTPLKSPCRHCLKPTAISLMQQKLFLTTERLLRKATEKISDTERNQANIWAVNYDMGIYEPFVEQDSGFKSKKILKNQFYPFVDGFELEILVKVLQRVGEGLNEKSLNMYLQFLKGMDEVARIVRPAPAVPQQYPSHAPVPAYETQKKPNSYQPQYIPHTPQAPPPLALLQYPSFSSSSSGSPPSLRPDQLPLLCPSLAPGQLPPLYQPPQVPSQLPSLPRILDNKPPLRSFNNMKELFELFDKIERASYAAARLMEAYADVIMREACNDCWAKNNLINDDESNDVGFVDPFPFPPVVHEQFDRSHSGQDMQLFTDQHNSIPTITEKRCEPLGSREGMEVSSQLSFGELGGHIKNLIKGTREKEDELERRWKERAKKREAARAGQLSGSKTGQTAVKPKRGSESQERDVIIID